MNFGGMSQKETCRKVGKYSICKIVKSCFTLKCRAHPSNANISMQCNKKKLFLFFCIKYYNCRIKPLVVGSCGPYGACLHDGSEYTGSYIDHVTEQV